MSQSVSVDRNQRQLRVLQRRPKCPDSGIITLIGIHIDYQTHISTFLISCILSTSLVFFSYTKIYTLKSACAASIINLAWGCSTHTHTHTHTHTLFYTISIKHLTSTGRVHTHTRRQTTTLPNLFPKSAGGAQPDFCGVKPASNAVPLI